MDAILTILSKLFDIGLIVVGFGLVIFIHELGHFVAAKWAKVRVLAFAIGFGRAIVSYRKGFGFRRGSSEQEYDEWLIRKADGATAVDHEVSPTEYRLNALPLGGYVKMLGQDDAHPAYRNIQLETDGHYLRWRDDEHADCCGSVYRCVHGRAQYGTTFDRDGRRGFPRSDRDTAQH